MRRWVEAAGACLLLLGMAGRAIAQDLPDGFDETFAVASLDPVLVRGVDAVVRLDLLRFEVRDPGSATQMVRRAVTVLRPEGRDNGELLIFHDGRLRQLKQLTGRIYDADGKVVRKLTKDDQEERSAISRYALYEDERVRVARLYHHTYPYTVEFEYEIRHDGLITWPTWRPQEAGMPVVFARFDVVTPLDVDARYWVRGGQLEPAVLREGRRRKRRWEIGEAPAPVVEPFAPERQEQVFAVYTAPTVFEIEGAQGDMRSWQDFGRWYYTVNEGRTTLPPEARNDVRRLTRGLSDVREKAQRLYTYMQERTRYVSIQLGLGGWQTFDATYVHERGYGDCKALTNYMHALLSEAGIPSFPALVRAGSRAPEIIRDFPSNQFNHVILYVELDDGEGIWLENTDQTTPFGHLGTFTEGRYALLVRPRGGELVRTPGSQAYQNQRVLNATVRLDPSADATAQIEMRLTGNQQDDIRQRAANRSGHEWLFEYIDVPSFDVVRADLSAVTARKPAAALSMTLTLPHYAAETGRRLFLPVNLLHRWTFVPPATTKRTQAIAFFQYAFADADTIRYELPEGFVIEALPDPAQLETGFLRYAARAEVGADGILVYYRSLEVNEPTFPAEQYEAFRDAMRQIAQADRAQVVLVAREGERD
ncbi:MAG: DUF3857 and transglutaminase domain-containing protein [Gemmatimonadota bacterium]|nr:DUF3857 and transglutaminase domain-containing protein [Gemmatimonadota bacterium]